MRTTSRSAGSTRPARAVAASLAAVLLAATQAQPAQAATWRVVPTPDPGAQPSRFTGVDIRGPASAWAVGFGGDTRPFLARWNGATWSSAPTPSVAGPATLNAVDGSAENDVWAVGGAGANTLTQHWNGQSWAVVASPAPVGATDAVLRSVKVFGSDNAWAVGDAAIAPGTFQRRTLITHWDGTAWRIVPSPSPDPVQNFLVAVDGTANDLWAAGSIGHDGYGGDPVAGVVLHWNGSSWTRVTIPGSDSTFSVIELHDLAAVGGHVWAVGEAFHRGLFRWVPYVLRWDGVRWQHATVPNPPDGALHAIAPASSNELYAVGRKTGNGAYIVRWNGSTWAPEAAHAVGVLNVLSDVAVSGGQIVAVGTQYDSSWIGRTLAVHGTG